MEELLDQRYQLVFENTSNQITNLIHSKDLNSIEDFERKLEALYVTQGNDIHGRGAIYDAMIEAEIAAYEIAYVDFKKKNVA